MRKERRRSEGGGTLAEDEGLVVLDGDEAPGLEGLREAGAGGSRKAGRGEAEDEADVEKGAHVRDVGGTSENRLLF